MALWPRRTSFGWVVTDDSPAGDPLIESEGFPGPTHTGAHSGQDALIVKRPMPYRAESYDGGKVTKTKPAWFCVRCKMFECEHTAVAVSEDSARRGVTT